MTSPAADPRRAEARRLWLDASFTQLDVAERIGVSRTTIRRWAAEDGWGGRAARKIPRKRALRGKLAGEASRPTSRPVAQQGAPRKSRGVKAQLLDRLFRLVKHNIEVMESRMSEDNASGKGEPERDTRTITSIVRSVEKLKELETEQSKRDTPSAGGRAVITPAEEDRIRRKVVEHILKLRERKRRDGGDR